MWKFALDGDAVYPTEGEEEGGAGLLWYSYVSASAMDMLFVIGWVGKVKL
jgi:hypothetical protein